ncbi:U3 small nucleolar RNA-associated protein 25 homolog [Anopheles darlingi]|uniref:U3 small nucleolar RNA-associated protein 25 homolog n=1 Tax=Anopheles darlingi TaxID=43151 RepID=UPI002100030F|nr:U3 small nucleolar RNA-associated protein 25 homolog [Anopheles darlingi]
MKNRRNVPKSKKGPFRTKGMKKKLKKQQANRPAPTRQSKQQKHITRAQETVEAQKRQIQTELKYRKQANAPLEYEFSDSDVEPEAKEEGAFENLMEMLSSKRARVSEYSEDEEDDEEDDGEEEASDAEMVSEQGSGSDLGASEDSEAGEEEDSVVEEDEEEDAPPDDGDSTISSEEEDTETVTDPYMLHTAFNISPGMLEALAAEPVSLEGKAMPFGSLGNIYVELPKQNAMMKMELKGIVQRERYATPGSLPVVPDVSSEIKWSELHVKDKIVRNITETPNAMQREVFTILNNYQDLLFTGRTLGNGDELRFAYCLHALNHLVKAVTKIQHHNLKLAAAQPAPSKKSRRNRRKKEKEVIDPEILVPEYRDQGLVRPKVLIVVPFRHSALKIVNQLKELFAGDNAKAVNNYKRFAEEYGGEDTLVFPQINRKPEDYEQTFAGNIDDNFRIGIAFNRSSMKLYTRYYASDLIIASPLGLRMTIGAEGESERDFDFLSSIEMLIIDQAEVCYAQNWDHVLHLFEHLHRQPKSAENTDFSRVRDWCLNGWTKFYRQTVFLSSLELPEYRSLFNKHCQNYRGKIRTVNRVTHGSIRHVVVRVPQSFQRIEVTSLEGQSNARFSHFVSVILPQARSLTMARCLIYVPSYFDFVRLRNYFKKEELSFTQICEYTTDAKIARARDMFYHGSKHFLLYSERSHFFRRHRIKGIRHLIMYAPPVYPHFYPEMINLMANEFQNLKDGVDATAMTATVLFTKYDSLYLSAILGTDRARTILQAPKSVHRLTTDTK